MTALARGTLTAVILLAAGCGTTRTSTAPTPTASPASVSIDVTKLHRGHPPRIGWRQGRELHDGARTVTFASDVDAVVLTRQRIITTTFADSGTSLDVRDRAGRSIASYPIDSNRPVLNAERNIVGWIDDNLTPWVLQDDQPKPLQLPKPPGAEGGLESVGQAVAVLGHDCAHDAETVAGAGCSFYVNWAHDPNGEAFVSSSHGFVDTVGTPHLHQLFDVNSRMALIGDDGAGVEHPTSRYVAGNGKGYVVAKNYVPQSFSPNGRLILASAVNPADGQSTDAISVRDAATGKPILTIKSPRYFYAFWQSAWEDNAHVLAVVRQGEGRWAIVRIGLDGTAETAVAPITTSDNAPGLDLTIQP